MSLRRCVKGGRQEAEAGIPFVRISFDLDDTLRCHRTDVVLEQGLLPAVLCRFLGEPLRRGTRDLMRKLRKEGWEVWVYTSSGPGPFQIRFWLALYGIRLGGVINETRHRRELAGHRFSRLPSKYPPAFGIDLHVDDSEGVRMEGEQHGFQVVMIRADDENWTSKVIAAASGALKRTGCPEGLTAG